MPSTCGPLAGFTGWERFAAYHFLSRSRFDIVHASEHLGELFYCIAAKRLGIAFAGTEFWIGCHGPSHWVIEANDDVVHDPFWIWTDATERFCVAYADLVWAPSRYMLGWLRENGFASPPARTFLQQYHIPNDLSPVRDRPVAPNGTRQRVNELVFFGRLETRKGIKLFLDALAALGPDLAGRRVTFMGRVGVVDGEPADAFVARRAASLGVEWQILSNLDRLQAYHYVAEPGRLVVAAAPVDNSPCAVYELLEVQAHLIACNGGGVPELIAPEWHPDVLFDYSLPSILERLRHCLRHGSVAPIPAVDRAAVETAWAEAHLALAPAMAPLLPEVPAEPVLGVVLHDGDLSALAATVAALRTCSSALTELVLVQSDRRGPLSPAVFPSLKRLALDAIGMRGVLEALAARGAPAIVLRAGTTLELSALTRLRRAGRAADAVVPFSLIGGARDASTELSLTGCEAWGILYGTARIGGLLSASALRRLVAAEPPPGSNILLWFDQALAEGCSVLPLPEPLLDGRGVDLDTHYVQDERARMTLWVGRVPVSQRMLVEAAYGGVVRTGFSMDAPDQASSAPDPSDVAHYLRYP